MIQKMILAFAASAAPTAFMPLLSHAEVLTYSVIGESAKLYDIDTETGVSSVRSELTIQDNIQAMDTRPSDGRLFLIGRDGDLYTADPDTGVMTWLGKTEVVAGLSGPVALAFHPTTEKLYAIRNLGGLYEISDIDGSTIASYPFGAFASMDFNSEGELYARGQLDRQLYQIDLDSRTWAPIGTGVVPGERISASIGDGAFVGDRLFTVVNTLDPPFMLYENDFVTGDAHLVANLPSHAVGLVHLPVPEPSSAALAISAVIGAMALRFRPKSTPT